MLDEVLTLHVAAFGKAWSLIGSPRNGQVASTFFKNIYPAGSTCIESVTSDFVKRKQTAWRRVCIGSKLNSLCVHPATNSYTNGDIVNNVTERMGNTSYCSTCFELM